MPAWLKTGPLLGLVERFGEPGHKGYRIYVEWGLVHGEADRELGLGNALAVGDAKFVAGIRRRYAQACARCRREDAVLRPARQYWSADWVWKKVLAVCQVEADLLQARKRGGAERGLMAWALQKYAGLTQRQVAERLGLKSGAAVSLSLSRLEERAATDDRRVIKWQNAVNLLFKG